MAGQLVRGRRQAGDRRTEGGGSHAGPRRVRRIADHERDAIAQALDDTRGNKKDAARRLGISRRALYRRLEKFGLAA